MGFLSDFGSFLGDVKAVNEEIDNIKNDVVSSVIDTASQAKNTVTDTASQVSGSTQQIASDVQQATGNVIGDIKRSLPKNDQ